MSHTTATIETAADLHNYLKTKKNFDFNVDHGRDEALYRELKLSLKLPDGSFVKALRAHGVSAEAYLRALISVAEPLAKMYREIFKYCERANFLKSKEGAKIEWEIESDGKRIDLSFEAFRLFEEIKTNLEPPSRDLMRKTKNNLMDWLTEVISESNYKSHHSENLDWKCVEIFRILASARNRLGLDYSSIFKGLNNFYLNGNNIKPSQQLISCVTNHKDYSDKLKLVTDVFSPKYTKIELIASKFIELPFWKFRWQVYEIWIIVVTLSEFERFGFQLVANPDRASLIELGREARLAERSGIPTFSLTYQPTYKNRKKEEIRPDIVIADLSKAYPENIGLIIECKQRINLEVEHLDQVRNKYEAGVETTAGELIIVNYDRVPSWSNPSPNKTTLIGNVRPSSDGEKKFRQFLRTSSVAKSWRREAWFVDVSRSMDSTLDNDFRHILTTRKNLLEPNSFQLYAFAWKVETREISDLSGNVEMSESPCDINSEEKGIIALCKQVRRSLSDTSLQLFIVSDIVAKIESQLSCEESHRICLIDPNREESLTIITEYMRN